MRKNILNLMMRTRLAVATITLLAIFASIPAVFADPLSPAEIKSLLARIREKRAAEPQVEADFQEEKVIRLMNKPIVSHFKSFFVIAILVAIASAAFEWSAPYSLTRSVLVYPLFLGSVAGFVLGQRGEYKFIGYFSAWVVDSALYWSLWKILLLIFHKTARRT